MTGSWKSPHWIAGSLALIILALGIYFSASNSSPDGGAPRPAKGLSQLPETGLKESPEEAQPPEPADQEHPSSEVRTQPKPLTTHEEINSANPWTHGDFKKLRRILWEESHLPLLLATLSRLEERGDKMVVDLFVERIKQSGNSKSAKEVRNSVAASLIRIRTPAARSAVETMIDDASTEFRHQLIALLGWHGDKGNMPALNKILEIDRDTDKILLAILEARNMIRERSASTD